MYTGTDSYTSEVSAPTYSASSDNSFGSTTEATTDAKVPPSIYIYIYI